MPENKAKKNKPAETGKDGSETPLAGQPEAVNQEGNDQTQQCPIAGFGASAGGLEAFVDILQHLPPDTGLAIVFVQHLDPRHASILTELLTRSTRMPVAQVTDRMQVEPNHIYVIPPNTTLRITKGVLRLEMREPSGQHMPIDQFFRSLAQDQGRKAVAVVLSGTASDGTLGLKSIKAEGGITFAQDPETAKYDGMPRSAIAAGCVDFVLSPSGIAEELVRLCRHPYLNGSRKERATAGPSVSAEPDFNEIFGMLRAATGVDFSYYKSGTIRRRTMRRMALHRMETPEQYVRLLKEHRGELDALFQDILINVTGFFREPDTFDALRTSVLPGLLANRSSEDPIRIWVPGCATGEEAYSIAIILLEYLREINLELPLQIFGTDLSEGALEKARAGVYPEHAVSDVSVERLRRFFVRSNGNYQIARPVRDVCIFAKQNVTKDPPFSRLDIITCRNVLIYLGPVLQAKVMRLFHYALKDSGFLVLGASETVGSAGELFAAIDKQHKIYRRTAAPAAAVRDYGVYEDLEIREPAKRPQPIGGPAETQTRVDQMILARYAPPAIVVDKALRILQFRGQTEPFLTHASGEASLSVMKMARAGLGAEIRALVEESDRTGGPVQGKPVPVSNDSSAHNTRLSVLPIHGVAESQYLVVFENVVTRPEKSDGKGARSTKGSVPVQRVTELEEELASTRRYLQSVIEEQEAATEELKSAHEEVQSSNEELQSTNEELLTAKEELQSTNEELTTVNEEMQSRNIELQQLNNDLINLLSSVNIPIIMLGSDLRIRRFTPQAEKILSLLPADIGRPLSDFRLKINVPDLAALCQDVIDTLIAREREVQDADNHSYAMWIRPYRTSDNRIDGVVLAFIDVTDRKQAAEARYRRLFESAPDGIVIADASTGEIVDTNPYLTRLLGRSRSSLLGLKFWDSPLFAGSDIGENLLKDLHERDSIHKTLTLPKQSGERVDVDIVASLYTEGEKKVIQFNIRDVSERKRHQEQLRHGEEQLRQAQKMEAVGRLAGGVAHDFNNILTAVLGYTELLSDELGPEHPGQVALESVRHGADRAVALTRQLLAFGRKQILSPAVLDPKQVVDDMRQLVSVMLNENVELNLTLQPDSGFVLADRTQLEQVVLNLVLNARDAMPGGGTINVTTSKVDVDENFSERHPAIPMGRYVAIAVKDTGTGMDEETKAHLFEPFFTTKPKGRGVGLGLSTVYSIVQQNGGYIWAYSELGVGTTFTVYLPRVEKPAEVVQGGKEQPESLQGTETILLVEDEPGVRSLARRMLENHGYRILEAASGPEALRTSRESKEKIDLLLTDVVMPRMSGRELALQLAPERPEMKVLYMSGHTEDAISHHGVLEPGIAFLHKPFTQQILAAKVRAVLDGEKGSDRATRSAGSVDEK